MTRADTKHDFDDLYTLEKLISVNSGWKVVYNIDERYLIEDVIAYASIRNGSYYELIPITPQDLHIVQSLPEYVLKNGYIGLITPENELVVNEHTINNIDCLNIEAIKEALGKNRFKLN